MYKYQIFAAVNLVGILLLKFNIFLLFDGREKQQQSGKSIFSLFKRPTQIEQIFVLRTFLYSNWKEKRSSTITLLNVQKHLLDRLNWFSAKCLVHSANALFPTWEVPSKMIVLHNVGQCRLVTCALICPHGRAVDEVVFRFAGSKPIKFPVSVPPKKKVSLLLCMGRVFFFEQWHMFITAMELYRLQRVDTVVAYIMSVHPAIYELMQMYARDGLLKVRANMEMPSDTAHGTATRYNPNSETEWNNQVVDLHDCLYEHRDGAEFIAFLDWDDLLISPTFKPLPGVFRKFAAYNADSATFLVARYQSYLLDLESFSEEKYTLRTLWERWLLFDKQSLQNMRQKVIGKIVVRPKFAESVNYHNATKLRDGFREIDFPPIDASILHLRLNKTIYTMDKLQIDGAQLERTFLDFVRRHNKSMEAFRDRLPKRESAIGDFLHCYLASTPDKDRAKNLKRKCPSVHHCPINKTKIELTEQECVNNVNIWSQYHSNVRGIAISVLERSTFERTNKCKFS
uniref:Glycosyltransferase family 92 protein n=1 Tax=Globodera rostochiensis TaxID=31243 RepID=A0A914HXF7_GLORO